MAGSVILSSFDRCGSNLSGASLLSSMYTKRNAKWYGLEDNVFYITVLF